MRITKYGHSCLLVEEAAAKILIDPGSYSTVPELQNIDVVLITHEHQDHVNFDTLKSVLKNNPEAKIYTNKGVGEKLAQENIPFELLLNGQSTTVKGVSIKGIGEKHAMVYSTFPIADNTGYLIASRLFHPGDALTVPNEPIEILAWPSVAPWMKLSEALDYGKAVKPKTMFPIHDGLLKVPSLFNKMGEQIFSAEGITWRVVEDGSSLEF